MVTHTPRWMLAAALAAVFLVAGCRVVPFPSPINSPTSIPLPEITNTPASTPTTPPTPLPTQSLTSTAGPEACTNPSGAFRDEQIPSEILGESLQYRVYLSPCYSENPTEPYPVLYLLHGQQQDATVWEKLGALQAADDLILSGASQPFLVVMPTERLFLLDLKDSDFDQVIAEELVPAIDAGFPTCTDSDCRAIGGISRGGAWAVRTGFSNPDLFGFIGAHSPAVFGADLARLPTLLREIGVERFPRIYLDTGNQDDYRESAFRLEGLLTQFAVTHEWHLNEGFHNFDYWLTHAPEYMRWYARNWR